MSNEPAVQISESQWHDVVAAVSNLGDHQPYWIHTITTAAPTFLAFGLGLISALFLDGLKTRRENRKTTREREERELSQLNVVSTAMGFNVEALQHLAMGQVLPHYKASHAANTMLSKVRTTEQAEEFGRAMSSEFSQMTTRCPEPYFYEIDLFKEIPFVLNKDPELLKLSGWTATFIRELKNNLRDRNDAIAKAGDSGQEAGILFPQLVEHVRVQAMISNAEVVHCLQFIQQVQAICKKLRVMVDNYKHISGAHLKVEPPAVMQETLKELEAIAKTIVPDWPPPEPPLSPT